MSRHVHALGLMAGLFLLAILPFTVNADEPTPSDLSGTQMTQRAQIAMRAEPSDLPNGRRLLWFDWTGGNWDQLTARLQLHGCGLQALWLRGRGWSWHVGLPEPFNRAFEAEFGDGQPIAAGELAAVCAEAGSRLRQVSTWPQLGLGETQVSWLLRPSHDPARNKQGQALIQYGGGSFYQLVSRLSTQGCNVHTLSINNIQYSFQNTNEQNKEFTDNYKEYIPKDTNIHISCIDNCDVIYGLDLVQNPHDRERIQNTEKCQDFDLSQEEWVVSYTECGDTWSEGARRVFSLMPVFQDVCKIEIVANIIEGASIDSGQSVYQKSLFQRGIPSIFIIQEDPFYGRISDIDLLQAELHELCHAHQDWYLLKEYVTRDYLRDNIMTNQRIIFFYLWDETPMAHKFNEIIGFKQDSNGDWYIENSNSVFNKEFSSYYNTNPKELSAQLCSVYLLEKVQPNSIYSQYSKAPYITEELKQWIEKYIVLPEPEMATDQG